MRHLVVVLACALVLVGCTSATDEPDAERSTLREPGASKPTPDFAKVRLDPNPTS